MRSVDLWKAIEINSFILRATNVCKIEEKFHKMLEIPVFNISCHCWEREDP